MIIPVRCYSCGAVVANKYERYKALLEKDYTEAEALNSLGLHRYCCRRMILSHIDMIDDLIPYSVPVVGTMQAVTTAGPGGHPHGGGPASSGVASAASGSSMGLTGSLVSGHSRQ